MTSDVLELTRMIGDKRGLEQDVFDTIQFLRENLNQKYMNKLHSTVHTKEREVVQAPSKEVTLLRALKGFAGPQGYAGIDRMISMVNFMNAARGIQTEVNSISQSSKDTIHGMSAEEEGSGEWAAGLTGMLLLMALAHKI